MRRAEALATLRPFLPELERDFKVARLSLFGSVARDEARPGSDVDVLVEFVPQAHVGLLGFVRLQRRLEQILNTQVDLATPGALKPQLRDRILAEAVRAA